MREGGWGLKGESGAISRSEADGLSAEAQNNGQRGGKSKTGYPLEY
jgi:hypothetical protein